MGARVQVVTFGFEKGAQVLCWGQSIWPALACLLRLLQAWSGEQMMPCMVSGGAGLHQAVYNAVDVLVIGPELIWG